MSNKPTVGFVGIGNMGWPMARNIAAGGYPTRVYDADAARARRFETACGGRAFDDLAAFGAGVDIVVTMLPTGQDVREVLLGTRADGTERATAPSPASAPDTASGHPSATSIPPATASSSATASATGSASRFGTAPAGLAAALRVGAIVIDMSSSDPIGTRELGRTLAGRGIKLIDAPVSGLVAKAETGTLTIMIGADDDAALAQAEPVLAVLGERLVRVGGLGCGHAMKALNNAVAATAFTVTAEALILGKRFGLDPAVMAEVMNASTGRNFHTDMSFPAHVLTRKFATGFSAGLLAKDVAIAADLGTALGATAPVIDLVSRLSAEARDEVGASEDNTALVKRFERLNGVKLEPNETPHE